MPEANQPSLPIDATSPAGATRRPRGSYKTNGRAKSASKGDLGFEAALWRTADELRGNLDSAEYKHVVLGLIFLKYISDAFADRRATLEREVADPKSDLYVAEPSARYQVLEDQDEYRSENIFWVPPEARWETLQAQAKQSTIGTTIDDAMDAIEKANPRLKGVLPRGYARPALDKRRLGTLIDVIGGIGLGDPANRSKDILGRVYEYFLSQFASAEGKKGGEFYTPRSVVRLLVEMLAPRPNSRIYDPCCGSGGMFIQSEKFVEERSGRRGAVSVFGQELNDNTWRMCQMNLAIRGIEADIRQGDTLHDDHHKDLKADYVLANPPFNISAWGGELLRSDVRWKYGVPPIGNANFAWVQHFIHHLSPTGTAGFVLANGSMSSNQSGEGDIRRKIVEDDLVDCMVALPGQLFYSTPIPVCLWFLTRDKKGGTPTGFRDRRGETLVIDGRTTGHLIDRTHRQLTDNDIASITRTYHAWRGEEAAGAFSDIPGFCKNVTVRDIGQIGYVLTPGRYVGLQEEAADEELLEDKIRRLSSRLREQFTESKSLEKTIEQHLTALGYGR